MSETSGFYDSTESKLITYSADDFNSLLSLMFTDGIIGDSMALRPSKKSGEDLQVSIKPGGALVKGYWYRNTEEITLTVPTVSSNARYDRVVVRVNKSQKKAAVVYRKGTETQPPDLLDNGVQMEVPICTLISAPSTIFSLRDERIFSTFRGGT